MKKISTSILSSIKYNRSNPEKLKEIIYGGKFETSKEAQMGIDFEQDLAIMNGNCDIIRTIPDDIADTWDWSYLESQTWAYTGK